MRRRRCQISDESKAMTTEVLLPRRLGSTWMLAWPARIGIGFIFAGILLVSKGQAFILPSARGFTGTHIRQSSTIRRGCVKEMLAMSERRGLWPSKQTIDFRSDTVTLPTAGMRKAMHKAEVGDDVLGEDPTVKRLEAETAEMLGKEAALFVPSGTMANLISHLVWCSQRGSEMILGDQSHSFLWEQGNAAQFGGIAYRPLKNLPDGTIDLHQVEGAVRASHPCFPVSRLVSIENTHAQCGGKVLPIEYLDDLTKLAQEQGLRVHMDGARLWNAAAALRLPPSRIAAGVDSVSVCFSKGLSAPVGSAIAGSAEFIGRAMRVRKALGGGMRQSGVVAAAAREGLRKQLPRIGDDNSNARRLAQGLQELGMPNAVSVNPDEVHSNIVLVTIGPDLTDLDVGISAAVLCDRLREKGVLALAILPGIVRFVTHSQVTSHDVNRAVTTVREVLEEAGVKPDPLGGLSAVTVTEDVSEMTESFPVTSSSVVAEAVIVRGNKAVPVSSTMQYTRPLNGDSAVLPDSGAARVSVANPETFVNVDPSAGDSTQAVDTAQSSVMEEAVSASVGMETPPSVNNGANTLGRAVQEAEVAEGLGTVVVEVVEEEGGARNNAAAKDDNSEHLESYEEVQLQGMTVSTDGFVAVVGNKDSGRALRIVVTPDDPMSGGLDVEQAETSEARTLLQLMQGIDIARHLRNDALGSLMGVPMSTGVQLHTVRICSAKPFEASLTAKIPHRDSEIVSPSPGESAAGPSPTLAAESAGNEALGAGDSPATVVVETGAAGPADGEGSAGVAQAGSAGGEGAGQAATGDQNSSSPVVTPPAVGPGRPRIGVTKEAISRSSFETLGLALRYPATKIYVRSELLARSVAGGDDAECSFDSSEIPDLYPDLLKLEDARTRKSAADEMEGQFEVLRLRQQLENAMNAGDSDRISSLREQLNKLVVTDTDTAIV